MDLRTVLTARLDLRAASLDDLDELHALCSDPAVWQHFPSGRHTTVERTRSDLEAYIAAWDVDGLSYWTARRRDDGTLVGVGGCKVRLGVAWNLYYRVAADQQGKGLASELARAALDAAREVRPDLPLTAYLLEQNLGSKAVAEKAGLDLVWRGPDAGNPDPDAVRLVYADRALDAETLTLLTQV